MLDKDKLIEWLNEMHGAYKRTADRNYSNKEFESASRGHAVHSFISRAINQIESGQFDIKEPDDAPPIP